LAIVGTLAQQDLDPGQGLVGRQNVYCKPYDAQERRVDASLTLEAQNRDAAVVPKPAAAGLSIAIAGSGGSGVMTAGTLLLDAAAQAGLYGLMVRTSGPQIRGGEAAALLRLAPTPVESLDDSFDLLLAIDLPTEAEWGAQKATLVADAERQRRLEAATVAFVRPGNAASEKTVGYEGAPDATPQFMNGRAGRSARSWFSYVMPVVDAKPMALVATYYTADRRTSPADFEILVDGARLAGEKVGMTDPGRFYDVVYAIPAAMVTGKQLVTVRFQAVARSQVAAVYGVRMVRADELP